MLDMEAIRNFSINKTDWKTVRLGDVVFEPKESVKDPVAEGIKHVVGLEHINSEDIHLRRSASIEESTTFTKKFSKGDVLFGRRRAYLKKAAKASFEGICSGDITVMRANQEFLISDLLPFIVNNDNFFDHAITHSAGGLSPRVKFKDIENYSILLPQLEEQGRLVELLKLADQQVEQESVLLEKLHVLYQSIKKDFFLNDDQYPERLIGELVKIKSGDSPSTFELNEDGIGIPFNKVADMNESIKYQNFAKEWATPIENKIIKPGSVIFPKRGASIMTNKVRIVEKECHVDTNIMALSIIDESVLLNEYLYYFLLFKGLYKIADTAQIPQINNIHINPYPINLPPLNIQRSLVDKLNLVMDELDSVKCKINRTINLKKELVKRIL